MGTQFIATHESMADQRHKDMLVASSADDIVLTRAFTGLQTNMLRPSIVAAGSTPIPCPSVAPSKSARTSTSEHVKADPRAGATFGAPATRRLAS